MSITLNRHTIDLLVSGDLPCPVDFRAEIARDPAFWEGGELWGFPCSAGGAALRATTGEGAICHGAGAVWGTWAVEESGLVFTADDSGVKYDALGVEVSAGEARDGAWVDCGALEYGRVEAKVDGDRVRISYTATSEDCADDVHEIRNAVESKLGVWIKTPSDHHWSDAEGAGEAVQTVARLEHQPTHEITQGGRVSLVCLIDGVGYERVDIESGDNADWELHGDEWLFQGQRLGGTVRAL